MWDCISSLGLHGLFRKTVNLNVITTAVIRNAKTADEVVNVFPKFIGYIVYADETSPRRFIICICL